MNEGAAVGYGGDDGEEGEIVDIETREREGVDFVDGSDEVGLLNGEVDKTSATVGGEVFGRFFEVGVHVFEDFKLNLEKLNRGAAEGNLGISDEGGGDEAHGFDRVFGEVVIDVGVELGAPVDGELGGADALDTDAELFEEETDVLDHVVGGGTDDGSLAGVHGGGHEDVFGDGVAALGQDDVAVLTAVEDALVDLNFVKATVGLGVNFEAERFESLEVRLYSADAKRTAASVGNGETLVTVK